MSVNRNITIPKRIVDKTNAVVGDKTIVKIAATSVATAVPITKPRSAHIARRSLMQSRLHDDIKFAVSINNATTAEKMIINGRANAVMFVINSKNMRIPDAVPTITLMIMPMHLLNGELHICTFSFNIIFAILSGIIIIFSLSEFCL